MFTYLQGYAGGAELEKEVENEATYKSHWRVTENHLWLSTLIK